jgi:hypothetical protein
MTPKNSDSIADPWARKANDWFRVIMTYGIGFVVASLAIVGVVYTVLELVPAYKIKIIEEGQLAKETREKLGVVVNNLTEMVDDFETRRNEFRSHESQEIKNVEAYHSELRQTNALLEKAQAAMMKSVEERKAENSKTHDLLQQIIDGQKNADKTSVNFRSQALLGRT